MHALLVKNAFFYNFVQCALNKKNKFYDFVHALLVKNAFFYNFVQCALNKKLIIE